MICVFFSPSLPPSLPCSSFPPSPSFPLLQAAVLRFINTIVQVAQGPNAKVFHQQEFIQAGFKPEEVEKVCVPLCETITTTSPHYLHTQSLHGRADERILHELKEWRNNFINIQSYMDNLVICKGKLRDLQEEVRVRRERWPQHRASDTVCLSVASLKKLKSTSTKQTPIEKTSTSRQNQ